MGSVLSGCWAAILPGPEWEGALWGGSVWGRGIQLHAVESVLCWVCCGHCHSVFAKGGSMRTFFGRGISRAAHGSEHQRACERWSYRGNLAKTKVDTQKWVRAFVDESSGDYLWLQIRPSLKRLPSESSEYFNNPQDKLPLLYIMQLPIMSMTGSASQKIQKCFTADWLLASQGRTKQCTVSQFNSISKLFGFYSGTLQQQSCGK